MLYNFAKASASKETLAEKMADIQKDALALLDKGGVSAFEAATEWRAAAAALVREVVIDTFKMKDPTPIFCDRRTGTMGDTLEFEQLINTLRVVEYSPQSKPQIFTPRKGKYTISTSSFEMAFGIPLQKIINRQHTIGEFSTMAAEALVRHYNSLVLGAVDTACAAGSTDIKGRALRTMAAGSDVAKTELDTALRRMYAYNSGVTIFGSRFALDAVYSMAGALSINLADELNARGVIGTYRGANMVELADDYNQFYQAFSKIDGIDMEKLLFISSGTKGATLMEKDLSSLNWQELTPREAQWSTGVRFEHGILVSQPWKYHVIQLA